MTIVAADTGGTFTDLVRIDADGRIDCAKVPSTPDDPGRAVRDGVRQLCGDAEVAMLLHGSTVATNSVLERRGARTALVVTAGFRDVPFIARQARPRLFSLDARRPAPLTPRERVVELAERMAADGSVLLDPTDAELERLTSRLAELQVEAVAVCLLHSYRNPQTELRVAAAIRAALPGVFVTASVDIAREYREFERSSTVVVNAYVGPRMTSYLAGLESSLARERPGQVHVMQSNGGLMSAGRIARTPARTVLSGLAAGAIGGVELAAQAGHPRVITLDIGGTSCDLALALDGQVRTTRSTVIGGLPVRLPAIDVHTLGAGGGSVAFVDDGGALQVGPRSAGAVPGPACYGTGGVEPTVTDANLVLGRLPAGGVFGGSISLDHDLAYAAVSRLAARLGLDVVTTAEGIVRVINANMARQIRVITVEKGVDPRSCALSGFGGGGPAHAADIARDLGIRTVLIPPRPGVTSALGLVLAKPRHEEAQTVLAVLDPAGIDPALPARLGAVLADLRDRVRTALAPYDGVTTVRFTGELRYARQGHELSVPIPVAGDAGPGPAGPHYAGPHYAGPDHAGPDHAGPDHAGPNHAGLVDVGPNHAGPDDAGPDDAGLVDAGLAADLLARFEQEHRARYGYALDGPVHLVTVVAAGVVERAELPLTWSTPPATSQARSGRTRFDGAWFDTPILPRSAVSDGQVHHGPLVIVQADTTTVVPPAARVVGDEFQNLVLTLPG